MGLLDTMVKTAATKILIAAGGNAAEKVIGAAAEARAQTPSRTSQKIAVPHSSEDYRGMNYEDVDAELRAFGFTNISFLPKKDLIKGWFVKDGAVESVIIGGKESFRKNAKFFDTERVVIQYHTYKNASKV